jgi:hypothetical protein
MDTLAHLLAGFAAAMTLANLAFALAGCIFGTLVGVLPGVGPAAGTAILIPITFNLDPAGAIIMLSAIYYGAMYGGTITSVLLNVPGEAASVITCIEGYQMARQGRGGAEQMKETLGGNIDVAFDNVGSIFNQVKAGQVRALAVMDTERSKYLPNVPTTKELGYPTVLSNSTRGQRAWNPPSSRSCRRCWRRPWPTPSLSRRWTTWAAR